MRGFAILGGVQLIEQFHFVIYILGATLLILAWRILKGSAHESDPEQNPAVRLVRRVLPVSEHFHGAHFFTREGGRRARHADAPGASSASSRPTSPSPSTRSRPRSRSRPTPFAIWAANVFALLGLRALFVLVEELIRRFRYLDQTIAIVLGIVGVKLLIEDLYKVGPIASLAIVLGAFVDRHHGVGARRPPRPRGRGRAREGRRMSAPGHVAAGTWSGGRFMHFGEPLDDDRLVALLTPGRRDRHRRQRRRVRRGGGRHAARPRAGRRRPRRLLADRRGGPRLLRGRARGREGLPALHRPAPARRGGVRRRTCGWPPSARSSAWASTRSTCCCCTTPTAPATRARRCGRAWPRCATRA